MCRDKDHKGRRCPSSHGETRNIKDRARYRGKKAAGVTTPVDPKKTQAPLPPEPIESLPEAAQETRNLIHSLYHREQGTNLGSSSYDPDDLTTIPETSWAEIEENVRQVGTAVEERASEIAGFTVEEAAARSNARAEEVRTRIPAIQDEVARIKNDLFDLRKEYNALQHDDPYGDIADVRARIIELQNLRDETIREEKVVAMEIIEKAGFGHVAPGQINPCLRKIQQGADPKTLEDMQALTEARLAALAEIREMGGVIEVDQKSVKRANEVLQEVADYYPTDWINASNELGNLYVATARARKASDGKGAGKARAEYHDAKEVQVKEPVFEGVYAPSDEPPAGSGWVKSVYTGKGWANPFTNPKAAEEYAEFASDTPENVRWVRPAYKMRTSVYFHEGVDIEGDPPRGWEEAYEQNWSGQTVRVFRAPEYTKRTVEVRSQLTIPTTNPEQQWQETKGLTAGIHEFAHRSEHANESIYYLEEAFLRRRTTGADGEREPLAPIYPGSARNVGEIGRFDSFADKYMGKEYNDNFREVLSTGMEAVFAGGFGGLAGMNGKTADADMRSFVLGVLATA